MSHRSWLAPRASTTHSGTRKVLVSCTNSAGGPSTFRQFLLEKSEAVDHLLSCLLDELR